MVGRNPVIPLNEAGSRTEPPVSLPIAASAKPAATATADPLDEPPEIWRGFQALTAAGALVLWPVGPIAHSCRLALPMTTAPARRRRATIVASAVATLPAMAGLAAVVGTPATSMLSLIATVIPCSGPRTPSARSSSRAAVIASSASMVTKDL